MREGSAIHDFLNPDRVVVGSESPRALALTKDLYAPLLKKGVAYLETNLISSEFIKYASNAFLATKLSFINEMAQLADVTGADITMIAEGMGLDKRIGSQFLRPGPGFGGSCFPKDCNALIHMADEYDVDMKLVRAAVEVNQQQRHIVVEKLLRLMKGNVQGKTIAVLGLAFKANTDDVRESPALDVIKIITQKGALVKAYDPVASHTSALVISDITYTKNYADAVKGADAV